MQTDNIKYVIYNTNFDTLNRVVTTIKNTLNVNNIQNSSLAEDDIRFLETTVRFGQINQAEFSEGKDYFYIPATVAVMYTYEPSP